MEEIEFNRSGDTCTIFAKGEIDLSNSNELRKTILGVLKTDQKVRVNLSDVNYIDSSGIASLVEGLQMAKSQKKSFVLIQPSEQVKAIMELARLDKVFTIE